MTGAGDTETVTVVRGNGLDRFGDPNPGAVTEFDIPGCLFAPGRSEENNVAASQVDTDGAIYAPPGTDVRADDNVRIRGDLYSVAGKPEVWGSFGVVIKVRLVTG